MRSKWFFAVTLALLLACTFCSAAAPMAANILVLSIDSPKLNSADETPLVSAGVPTAASTKTVSASQNEPRPADAEPVDATQVEVLAPAAQPLAAPMAEAVSQPCPTPAVPAACVCALRPQDQFWLIQTGHLPWIDCQGFSAPQIGIQRFQCESNWSNATLAEFLAGSKDTNTVFYVPGNRVPQEEAVNRGWMVYGSLKGAADERPMRIVVWSWPNDRVHGLRRDVRLKADRTSTEAMYFGWLLAQMDPAAHTSFLGYSFGARIVCGGLHAVYAGSLEGLAIPDYVAHAERRRARVVLLAPASHNYWLLPGQIHGEAINMVDRMLISVNPCDPALMRYAVLDKCQQPSALGYTGLVGIASLGEAANRIRQINASGMVGKSHDEKLYLGNPSIQAEVQRYLLSRSVDE